MNQLWNSATGGARNQVGGGRGRGRGRYGNDFMPFF
jgi:hypothetical protein